MDKRMRFSQFLFPFIGLAFIGCIQNHQLKFNKQKWNEKKDSRFIYKYRNGMLNDLTTNYKLVGAKYDEIFSLLGESNYEENNIIAYKIVTEFGTDIDPIYTKILVFNLSKDSIVTSFQVKEWKD